MVREGFRLKKRVKGMVSLVLLAGVLVLTLRQEGAAICEAKIHKGHTKDGVTYQYDTKTKTLTMSGKTIKGNTKNTESSMSEMVLERKEDSIKRLILPDS